MNSFYTLPKLWLEHTKKNFCRHPAQEMIDNAQCGDINTEELVVSV